MPLYRYQAIGEKGKKVSGTVDADSLQDAKLKLIRRQIALIRLELLQEKDIGVKLKKKELLALTREMTRLLQAGIPLFETLSALEEKYRGQKMHTLLLDLCDQVRGGRSFSDALMRHKKVFDILFTAMVSNAEKTGTLAQALEDISLLLSRQIHMQKQLLSALLYPCLLGTFCLVVLSSLLFFVIPSLKELFDERNLHPFTRIVFATSEFACKAKGYLLFALLSLVGGGIYLIAFPKGKKTAARIASHLPWIKTILAKIAFVRFCRASATLLEKVVMQAEVKLSEGQPLHAPFQNHPLIPPLVPRMMAIAQQGGRLPYMMQQIAQIYEEELETLLAHFTAMAQPILLLVLGGIIGFVLLSVLLPLTDVSSFVT